MPIPFRCPHCGVQTNVADEFAGQTGPCGSCGQAITIPATAAAYPSYERPQRSSGPAILLVLGVVALAVLVFGGIMVALLLPAVGAAREAARRAQCSNNLKQIALAVHNYHDSHDCFPTAATADEDGNPMRSWRVAIMPFLNGGGYYDQYDFDEPWDSPTNQSLAGLGSIYYRCPSETGPIGSDTSYVMIVGKDTIGGEPNEVVRMTDVTDGTSNTILAIEVAASGIPWMEPRDMTVEEAVEYITNPAATEATHAHLGGVNVALADGSVRFIAQTIDPGVLRSMMLRNDGQ